MPADEPQIVKGWRTNDGTLIVQKDSHPPEMHLLCDEVFLLVLPPGVETVEDYEATLHDAGWRDPEEVAALDADWRLKLGVSRRALNAKLGAEVKLDAYRKLAVAADAWAEENDGVARTGADNAILDALAACREIDPKEPA